MKKKYRILVYGCDDFTSIEKDLTIDEFKFIQSIAVEITETSTYICMPTMGVELIKNE